MGSEWRTASIEKIAKKVACGPFGSSIKVSTFVKKGVPIVSGQHLRGTKLEDGEFNYITYEHAEKLINANVYPGDVIFTHAGNIGQVAYIPKNSQYKKYVLSQRQFYIRLNVHQALPEFITYFFHSPEGRHKLLANSSQTGVPSIARPVSYLKSIEVPIPPLPEQQAIAHILGSLDDRIELNRRMNSTLEAMARTIFKSWFVDFDPVRAKIEGRPTGLPDEVASLFPDSFDDSELGEIPKGWKVVALPEIIDINPTRKLKQGQIAPYLEMKNLPENTARAVCWYDRNFSSGVKFINGDTLMARITPCLENGKGAFVDFLEDGQVGWGSTEYIVFRAKEPLPLEYSYFLSRTKDFRSHAIVNMTGSSGRQRVPASIFDDYLVARPSKTVAESFGMFSGLVMRKIKENDEITRSLSSLRDALLPKLISGELRVPDAERFVEEAGL